MLFMHNLSTKHIKFAASRSCLFIYLFLIRIFVWASFRVGSTQGPFYGTWPMLGPSHNQLNGVSTVTSIGSSLSLDFRVEFRGF